MVSADVDSRQQGSSLLGTELWWPYKAIMMCNISECVGLSWAKLVRWHREEGIVLSCLSVGGVGNLRANFILMAPSSNYTLQTWLTLQNQIQRSCSILEFSTESPSLSFTASHKSLLYVSGAVWKIRHLRMPLNATEWHVNATQMADQSSSRTISYKESQSEVHFYAQCTLVWLPGEMTEAWPLASVSDRNDDVHSEWQTGSYSCCSCCSAGSAWHWQHRGPLWKRSALRILLKRVFKMEINK